MLSKPRSSECNAQPSAWEQGLELGFTHRLLRTNALTSIQSSMIREGMAPPYRESQRQSGTCIAQSFARGDEFLSTTKCADVEVVYRAR